MHAQAAACARAAVHAATERSVRCAAAPYLSFLLLDGADVHPWPEQHVFHGGFALVSAAQQPHRRTMSVQPHRRTMACLTARPTTRRHSRRNNAHSSRVQQPSSAVVKQHRHALQVHVGKGPPTVPRSAASCVRLQPRPRMPSCRPILHTVPMLPSVD